MTRSLLLLSLVLSAPAFAHRSNAAVYGYAGLPGDASSTCSSCHVDSFVPRPTVEASGLEDLVAGGSATVLLKVLSGHSRPEERVAGLVAASEGAGVFTHATGLRPNHCDLGNAVKTPEPPSADQLCDGDLPCPAFFDENGEVTYELVLEDLQPGEHTLYVGVNDANNNGLLSGDRGATASFPFTVSEGDGGAGEVTCAPPRLEEPAVEEARGCRCASPGTGPGASLAAGLLLGWLGWRGCRRRRRAPVERRA